METVSNAEPVTESNQLARDHLNGKDNNFNINDCFINVTPGTSKLCKIFANSEDIHKDLQKCASNDSLSTQSAESVVCRICQNGEYPEKLVSPCLCKGTLAYVHINCLERWISMSHCTMCELCQFQYNTQQTLRYSLIQSLRIWYSRSMSRRALQEDCQMFSLLTLVAFGIVGTLLVAVQYYILQGHVSGFGRLWTKGWLIFFLFTTLVVYLINVYMIVKSQMMPWYRWWQSARDIRLILENHRPVTNNELKQMSCQEQNLAQQETTTNATTMLCHQQNQNSQEMTRAVDNKTIHNDHQQYYQECNNKIFQNMIESLTARTLCLNPANNFRNNHQLPWKNCNNDVQRTKNKLAIPLDDATTGNITRIAMRVNKSAVATIATNIDMPLESSPVIFDGITVV